MHPYLAIALLALLVVGISLLTYMAVMSMERGYQARCQLRRLAEAAKRALDSRHRASKHALPLESTAVNAVKMTSLELEVNKSLDLLEG